MQIPSFLYLEGIMIFMGNIVSKLTQTRLVSDFVLILENGFILMNIVT